MDIITITTDTGTIEVFGEQSVTPEIVAFAIGPKGEDGVITPELEALYDATVSAKTDAETARDQAQTSAQTATDAIDDIHTASDQALADISTASSQSQTNLSAASTQALADLETSRTQAIADVDAAGASYVTDAQTAATNAGLARDLAQKYADEDEDVEVETGLFSAKHWALKAKFNSLGAAKNIATEEIVGMTATNVQAALLELWTGKADVDHVHSYNDLTDLPVIPSAPGDIGAAPAVHTHEIADVNGLQGSLDLKATIAYVDQTKSDILGGLPSEALDTITELAAAFEGADADIQTILTTLSTKSDSGHTHTIADVTGLQDALDAKSDVGHTHTIADVTGLQSALDSKSDVGHTHAISEIANLQTSLDAKLDLAGGIMSGPLSMPASAATAFFNLPHGTEPTTLVDGDIWTTTAGLSAYIDGSARSFYHDGNLAPISQTEAETGTATELRAWSSERVRQAISVYAAPISHSHEISEVNGLQTALDNKALASDLVDGLALKANTDDVALALADKAAVADLAAHVGDTDNPHGVTKAQLGLENVANTAPADLPVSTAQQAAIDAAAATLVPKSSAAAIELAAGFVASGAAAHAMSGGNFSPSFDDGNFQLVSHDAAGTINAPVYAGKSGTMAVGVINTATAGGITIAGCDNTDLGDAIELTDAKTYVIFFTLFPGITLGLVKAVN